MFQLRLRVLTGKPPRMRAPAPCPIGGEGVEGPGGRFGHLQEQAHTEAPQHGPCPQAPLPHPEITSALTCCRFCSPSGSAASTGSAMRRRRSSSSRSFSRSASTSLPMRLASCSSMYCFLRRGMRKGSAGWSERVELVIIMFHALARLLLDVLLPAIRRRGAAQHTHPARAAIGSCPCAQLGVALPAQGSTAAASRQQGSMVLSCSTAAHRHVDIRTIDCPIATSSQCSCSHTSSALTCGGLSSSECSRRCPLTC